MQECIEWTYNSEILGASHEQFATKILLMRKAMGNHVIDIHFLKRWVAPSLILVKLDVKICYADEGLTTCSDASYFQY